MENPLVRGPRRFSLSHQAEPTARPVVETPTSLIPMGIARGDITPPVGIYHRMWGAALHDRAEGVHRPLLATVVAFGPASQGTKGGCDRLLIALDHCLFGPTEVTALQQAVTERTGIPAAHQVLVFSHTHAAGLMLLDRVDLPGGDLIPPYLAQVNRTVAELAEQATRTTQPTTLTYTTGHCDLATHRDYWDPLAQQWVCGFHPGASADTTLLVVRATDAQQRTVASFVNYACHPTTLAWDNRLISPDFPGALRALVEQETGGAPCVFLQGASGELGPREGFVGDVQVADRNGRQVGFAALSALASLPPPGTAFQYQGPVVSGATLGAWKHVPMSVDASESARQRAACCDPVPVPYRAGLPTVEQVTQERDHWQREEAAARERGDTIKTRDARAMVERGTRMLARLALLPAGPNYPYQLHVWRLGDAVWVAAQGELYSCFQTELRARFPGTPLVVCTLANGWGPSYIPPAELYDTGLYQESIAVLAAGSLEQILGEAVARVRRCLEQPAGG